MHGFCRLTPTYKKKKKRQMFAVPENVCMYGRVSCVWLCAFPPSQRHNISVGRFLLQNALLWYCWDYNIFISLLCYLYLCAIGVALCIYWLPRRSTHTHTHSDYTAAAHNESALVKAVEVVEPEWLSTMVALFMCVHWKWICVRAAHLFSLST